jgi:hypothetical protein
MIAFFFALLVLITGSLIFQLWLPPLLFMKGAAILVTPAIYFYGCLSLPFPLVLGLTLVVGLFNDLLTVPQAAGDFPIGASILIYLIPGLIMHGFRPLFLKNRWEYHWLLAELAALLTPLLLLFEYAILSFQRKEFPFTEVIAWRIFGPGLISALIAPCVFFILTPLSHWLRYRPELDAAR